MPNFPLPARVFRTVRAYRPARVAAAGFLALTTASDGKDLASLPGGPGLHVLTLAFPGRTRTAVWARF